MFSIYSTTGQNFRGTLEALMTVPELTAVRHKRGLGREGEEAAGEPRLPGQREAESDRFGQAVSAYHDMLRLSPERGPVLHAYQLMTRDVFTVRPEATVEEAWHALVGYHYGQAPVLDRTLRLVGQVSTWDLLTVINVEAGQVRDVLQRRVADVMTSPVVSVDPVSDVRRVARVLLAHGLAGMPVMTEQHELVGIITRSDLLRALANDPPLSLWA